MNRVERYMRTAALMDEMERDGTAFIIRPEVPAISKFEQDSRKIMEFYHHGYTLMDSRMMELVSWERSAPFSKQIVWVHPGRKPAGLLQEGQ